MHVLLRRLPVVLLPLALFGCEQVEKSSNPLAPTVAGPQAGISIDVPGQLSPGAGAKVDDNQQPVAIVIGNPSTNSQRPIVLGLQVGVDPSFGSVVYSRDGLSPADGGTTTVRIDRLQPGRTYFWRVKADDGANASGWSTATSFEILNPVVIGVPTPKSPVGGVRVLVFSPLLVVTNGVSSGPSGGIRYHYQVSADPGFGSLAVNSEHV